MILRVLLGLLLSGGIGWAGYRLGALTRSGWLGAVLIGTAVFGFGGWPWAFLLLAFFFSASALTRHRSGRKTAAAVDFAQGEGRDLGQALANGGIAALLAAAWALAPQPVLWWAFAGSLAAVTADTWATEVGMLSPRPPRRLWDGARVPPGTSGAISPVGTLAAALGALALGTWAWVLSPVGGPPARIATVGLAGFLGALFDSLLGAIVQGVYWCAACEKETERPVHRCGRPARLRRGWPWVNNDVVNALAALAGALAAALLSR